MTDPQVGHYNVLYFDWINPVWSFRFVNQLVYTFMLHPIFETLHFLFSCFYFVISNLSCSEIFLWPSFSPPCRPTPSYSPFSAQPWGGESFRLIWPIRHTKNTGHGNPALDNFMYPPTPPPTCLRAVFILGFSFHQTDRRKIYLGLKKCLNVYIKLVSIR